MGNVTTASGGNATAMGNSTTASANYATAMGNDTEASGVAATAMGIETTASGNYATATGSNTTALGFAAVSMGYGTTAQAYGSLVIGQYNLLGGSTTAWVATDALFVAGNGTSNAARSNALTLLKNGDLNTTGTHKVTLASGGTRPHLNLYELSNDYARIRLENSQAGFWDIAGGGPSNGTLGFWSSTRGNVLSLNATGAPITTITGASLSAGGAWTNASDSTLKTGIAPADAADVLARLVALPVLRWTYKADPDAAHVGPMAQSFRAAFGLGSDERSIATVDADGVLMLAAQALDARTRALEGENAALRAEVAALRARLAAVEALFARVAASPAPVAPRAVDRGR